MLFTGFHQLIRSSMASFLVSVTIGSGCVERGPRRESQQPHWRARCSFFFVTSFALWALDRLFSKNGGRPGRMYVAGIPLFWNTLAGDAFYATCSLVAWP